MERDRNIRGYPTSVTFSSFVSVSLARGYDPFRQNPAIYIQNQCFILNSDRSVTSFSSLTAFRRWNEICKTRNQSAWNSQNKSNYKICRCFQREFRFLYHTHFFRSWNNFKLYLLRNYLHQEWGTKSILVPPNFTHFHCAHFQQT
jgi:hypothetical protein